MSLLSLEYKLNVVSEALRNTLLAQRFAEEYSCLLQEHISQEDYDEAMKEYSERLDIYARKPRELSDAEIAITAKILLSVVGEELDSVELAEMMNADVMNVEYALRRYSADKAVYPE